MSKTCIVCQSVVKDDGLQVSDHLVSQEVFNVIKCSKCGFRFLANPPSQQHASRYYETEEYIEHSDSSKGIINKIYHFARQWMFRYKYHILKKLAKDQRILDFGTGTGYFLNFMQAKGFSTTGVEISEKARNFGIEQFNLDIRPPEDIYKPNFPGNFGYISFWHVLEHIYDPVATLTKVKSLMSDDGALIIALPNHRCLDEKYYQEYWAAYDVPRHLWHWDKKSFKLFAEKVGFRLVKTKILPLDPFYNSLISESYRKKKWAYILIPIIGTASLLRGWFSHDRASSIIYILEKA